MARPWGLVVHGGSTDRPAFVNGGDDLEVKLKDYLDGATVLFDAAGNVVDGHLQGDSSPWVISPTEDGKKCTSKTEPGQKYCWQHAKSKPEAKPAAKPAAK